MEVGNNIYNPAAVTEGTSSRSSNSGGREGSYKSDKNNDSVRSSAADNTDSKNRTISNLSRARAAAGNPNLSTESQEAIKNGALAPTVAQPPAKAPSNEEVYGISDISKQLASTGSIKASFAPESTANPSHSSSAAIGSIVNITI